MPSPQQVQPGDRVRMRKPHACGGDVWIVYRIGADIGLHCATCGRHVFLVRSVFNKQCRHILSREPLTHEGFTQAGMPRSSAAAPGEKT